MFIIFLAFLESVPLAVILNSPVEIQFLGRGISLTCFKPTSCSFLLEAPHDFQLLCSRNAVPFSLIHLRAPFLILSFLDKDNFLEANSLRLLPVALAGSWQSERCQHIGGEQSTIHRAAVQPFI